MRMSVTTATATFAILFQFLMLTFDESHAWSSHQYNRNRNHPIISIRNIPQRRTSTSLLAACKRRQALQQLLIATTSITLASSHPLTTPPVSAVETSLQNFVYRDGWVGTSLPLLSPIQAAEWKRSSYDMGRWPDAILRRPASIIDVSSFGTTNIRSVANTLRRTARENGAVGLAAQQCGIDISIIFLDDPKRIKRQKTMASTKRTDDGEGGLFLVNPRIIARSPEVDMKVWREECLVLPPSFTATVLRDSTVRVQYETLMGETKDILLQGELARCLQHELDHDRGILITDHVDLDDLESPTMRDIETYGHDDRMFMAYSRFISEPSFNSNGNGVNNINSSRTTSIARDFIVPPANAYEETSMTIQNENKNDEGRLNKSDENTSVPPCDDACREERKRRIEERRAMMRQSRSSTSRSEVFELSKQRAKLYGTDYQGASCPPGIPCI